MKIFEVIVDDGTDVIKDFAYAKNKKQMLEIYGGNGEFLKIKDITNDFKISINSLENTLIKSGYGKIETNLICKILKDNIENIID